jgi:hypothetical protein
VTDAPLPLPIEAVDLESLVLARNDGHPEGDWWFDPRTGESLYHGLDDDSDLHALVAGDHVVIPFDPQPQEDVDDFIAGLDDEAEAARLHGAFRRRGGLRRFREQVSRGPCAEDWQRFALRRETRRAVDWLLARGLVDPTSATALRDQLAD